MALVRLRPDVAEGLLLLCAWGSPTISPRSCSGASVISIATPPPKQAKYKKDGVQKRYGMGAFPFRKDALIKKVQDAAVMISESRVGNYTAMLQKSTMELTRRQGDESDCPHDSTALQDEVAELIAAGDTLMEKAKKCREATIDSLEEATQKYESKINALGDKAKEHVEAVGYKTSCKINEARAQYQKTYWQTNKIAQQLVEGSHPTSVAKIFSERISQQLKDMDREGLAACRRWSDVCGGPCIR